MLLDMHDGVDPRAGRGRSPTLRQTLDDYLKTNRSLSERSRAGYRTFVDAYLKKWLDRPLREITREDVGCGRGSAASREASRGGPDGRWLVGEPVPGGSAARVMFGGTTSLRVLQTVGFASMLVVARSEV